MDNPGAPCGYDVTNTKECDGSDTCSNYCNSNTIYAYRDYYTVAYSNTCTSAYGSVVYDCTTRSSSDTDSGPADYTTAGTVTDFTSCTNGASSCIHNDYSDSCAGTVLTEYGVSGGSSYTSDTKQCQDYEGDYYCSGGQNNFYRYEWGCSGSPGRCNDGAVTDTQLDRDSSSSYCVYAANSCTAWNWSTNVPTSGSQCCGDDNTTDNSYYYNATPSTAASILCERCNAGSYVAPAVYYGNGYITGSTCYYSDIACSAASGANGTSCTLDANDICGDGTNCLDCTASGYLRQNTTACYTSCTTNAQCAPSYSCRANSQCENDVLMYSEFITGKLTTNISSLSSSNSNVNLTLELNDNTSMIRWRNTISMNSSWNVDSAVDLNSTFAFVNSSKYPPLNSPANISVFGMLGFKSTPVILRDGLPCTDCQIISWNLAAGNLTFNVTGFSNYTWVENSLNCYFLNETSCPSGHVKLIGVKNDSGGYDNSHAQNYTIGNYNYSLCCNATNTSVFLSSGCGQQTVIKLNLENNSHVELGNETDYSISSCMNSSWGAISCTYPTGVCDANQTCVMSIASSEGDNTTNAHVGACNTYNQKVCCGIIQLPNYAPSAPTLYYPANNNMSVFERRPNFNWSASSDLNSDPITYTLNMTCGSSCPANCEFGFVSGLSTTNYTPSSALCVDRVYNWTVSACDYELCNASIQFNFSIPSVLDFVLTVNVTAFGTISNGANVNTENVSQFPPLSGTNNGNVLINTTVNATALFSSVAMNDYYFMFRSSNVGRGSSIADSCSQTNYTGMDNATQKDLFCNLSYTAGNQVYMHMNITVPINEPPGLKQSYIDVNPACADC